MDRDKLIERADILMFERGLTFGDAIVEAERETQPPDPGSGTSPNSVEGGSCLGSIPRPPKKARPPNSPNF